MGKRRRMSERLRMCVHRVGWMCAGGGYCVYEFVIWMGDRCVFVLSGILRLENVSQYCESHLEVIEQSVKHLQRVPSGKIAEVSIVAESLITNLFGYLD